jgi:hypothetical protein
MRVNESNESCPDYLLAALFGSIGRWPGPITWLLVLGISVKHLVERGGAGLWIHRPGPIAWS